MKKQVNVEKERGKWQVSVSGNNSTETKVFPTKAEAVANARAQANAQVVIHNATGQIIRSSEAMTSLSADAIRGAVLNVVRSRESAGRRPAQPRARKAIAAR